MKNQIQEGATTIEALAEFNFDLPTEQQEVTQEVPDLDLTPPAEEVITTDPPVIAEVPKFDTKPNQYATLAKRLIERGDWEDAEVEDSEGNVVKLSELTDLDEDYYLSILESQKTKQQEEIKEKFVSVEGLDENQKKLINIIKEKGDLRQIFQTPDLVKRPFEEADGWDIDDESHQSTIVFRQYLANGNDEDQAKLLVEKDKKDSVLDEKAKRIVDFHQSNYDKTVAEAEKAVQAERIKEQEDIKKYRSELSKLYKEQGIQDVTAKKLIDLATKENKEGMMEVDRLYNEVMEDPKRAQELIYFLADKENYLKLKAVDSKRKDNIETFKTISFIPKNKDKKTVAPLEDTTSTFSFDLP